MKHARKVAYVCVWVAVLVVLLAFTPPGIFMFWAAWAAYDTARSFWWRWARMHVHIPWVRARLMRATAGRFGRAINLVPPGYTLRMEDHNQIVLYRNPDRVDG